MSNNERTHSLFPAIEPYSRGFLQRDGGHEIYWEQSGNPEGVPVVFLHGGPGAGCAPFHRRFFDPAHYRIVAFDQRGAGRSRPHAEIRDNTTAHLIADIEALRRMLEIERWLVFGGSWGAALALAYGIRHAGCCTGFVLRGVFLGRPEEGDWFLHGMGRFFPEARRNFIGLIPETERENLLGAYLARLLDPDPDVHLPAAHAWMTYETSCSTLRPATNGPQPQRTTANPGALSLARIGAHYFAHGFFLNDTPILENLAPIVHLPAVIVQGRYDMVCPITTADALAAAWPGSKIVVIPDAGHSALEPGICAALVAATEEFKRRLRA